jgi:hypothetical protein
MMKRQEGGKRLKHGPADRKAVVREEQALIRSALSMACKRSNKHSGT